LEETLLEQWCAEYLTTGAVAEYCGVTSVTVLRWIRKGHLPAFRLPEGHYRISRNDFGEFLVEHGIPIHKHIPMRNKRGK